MKLELGWWWPDDEVEVIEWMKKHKHPLNGRESYQGRKQDATLKHCRSFHTAIDVGGHIGLWSFNLAHAFDRVVVFEPVDRHRECFAHNVPAEKVLLYPYALGAQDGYCSIKSRPGSSGDSCVHPGRDVEMKRLDDFALTNVDLIKIDCEGYEENVLRGGEETIKAWMPTIVVEQKRDMATRFGLKPQGGVRLLEKWGYKLAEEIGGDFIMVPK